MSDRESYESMPLEELGVEGCCKVFCREYKKIAPDARVWGVRRKDGRIAHVFLVKDSAAYDIRGKMKMEDMKTDSSESISLISEEEFKSFYTFADDDPLLRDVAALRFSIALKQNPTKYGLRT
jgi:hypothetical protein